jgi:hypothetical protein
MRAVYPSGGTRGQFSMAARDLQSARKAAHPRAYDPRDIFCAILYALKEGRGLPRAFPKRSAARRIWSAAGENGGASPFDRVSQEPAPSRREPRGREPKTTMAIIGAQSVKNADTAEGKGYGAGKKLRGEGARSRWRQRPASCGLGGGECRGENFAGAARSIRGRRRSNAMSFALLWRLWAAGKIPSSLEELRTQDA